MNNGLWDFLLGREEPVYQDGVMSPVIGTKREGGMLGAVAEPLSYAPGPTGMVATGVDAYAKGGLTGLLSSAGDVVLGAVGGKAGPMLRKIAAGENARKIPAAVQKSIDKGYEIGVPGKRVDSKVWMGMEGRPRWEISDRAATVAKGIDDFPDGAMIDKVLKHDELFKQYPQLKDYRILPLSKAPNGAKSMEEGALGAHDAKNKIIYVKPGLDKQAQLSTILHEIQHGVQDIEGHVSGASSTAAMHLAMNMMENYKAADPEKKRLLRAQMKATLDFDPEGNKSIKTLANKMYSKKYGEVEARTTQERQRLTQNMTDKEILDTFGEYTDVMNMEEANPILWQETWKKMFGHRELPPFVNVQTGKTIPIRD